MCDWVNDRYPTIDEVRDHELVYATIRVKPLRGDVRFEVFR